MKIPPYKTILKYERYIVYWISIIASCAALMYLAKNIFSIHIAQEASRKFVETIGVSGFVVATFSAWWSYSSEKRQQEKLKTAKVEQQNASAINSLKESIIRQEATDERLERYLSRQEEEIKEINVLLGRLSVQVYQQQSLNSLIEKIKSIEDRINKK